MNIINQSLVYDEQLLKSSRLINNIDLNQSLIAEKEKSSTFVRIIKRVFKKRRRLTLDELLEKEFKSRQKQLQLKRLELISDPIYNAALPTKSQDARAWILRYSAWFSVNPPDSGWVMYWNIVIAIVILFYIFEIGLVIFFGDIVWQSQRTTTWSIIFNVFSVIALTFDIVVTLNKGYYQSGILVTNRNKILEKYLKYQGLIDITSILIIVIPFIEGSNFSNYAKILFFFKIINLYEIDIMLQRVLVFNMKINSSYLIFRQIVMVLIASHYYAVTYWALSKWIYDSNYYGPSTPSVSWIYQCQAYSDLISQKWQVWYLYSIYFTIGVITTIANGDITPLNPIQSIYNIIFMTLCILQFSYVIWNIIQILLMSRAAQSQRDNQYIQLKKFMRSKLVPSRTQVKVKAFVEETWSSEMYRDRNIQKQFIQKLPLELKSQLMVNIYQELLHSLLILSKFPNHFVPLVSQIIQQNRYSKNQTIFSQNQAEIKTYYLSKGKLSLYYQKQHIRLFETGNLGLVQFYLDQKFPFKAVAQQNLNLYEIKKQKFLEIIQVNQIYAESAKYVTDLLRDRHSTLLSYMQKCLLCCSPQHYYTRCPVFFFRISQYRTQELLISKPQKRLPFRKMKPVHVHCFKTLKRKKNRLSYFHLRQSVEVYERQQLPKMNYDEGNLDDLDGFIEQTQIILKQVSKLIQEEKSLQERVYTDMYQNYEAYFPRYNIRRILTSLDD